MEDKILESFVYVLPAIVTGVVAYFFFKTLIAKQTNDKGIEVLIAKKREALQIKLNAYERMLLFCERINPTKLLLRVKPISENAHDYLQLLISNIEQEFEHNMVQQIYISNQCWNIIITSKGTVLSKLREIGKNATSANSLREAILLYYAKEIPPTDTAITLIKSEVKKLL